MFSGNISTGKHAFLMRCAEQSDLDDTEGLQQKCCKKHRCNNFDHDDIQFLSSKLISTQRHLIDDDLRFYHPSDQNAGEKCNKRHQKVIADEIHHIQDLSGCAVWKLQFKIKCIVAKAYDDADARSHSHQSYYTS